LILAGFEDVSARTMGENDGRIADRGKRDAQLGQVSAQDVSRGPWRLISPDPVDEPVGPDDLIQANEKDRKHGSLPGVPDVHPQVANADLYRPENPEFHSASRFAAQGPILAKGPFHESVARGGGVSMAPPWRRAASFSS
jgi:hypothetical protein